MNSYEIITDGLKNGLSNSKIIDALQEEYPTSRIENNINLVTETRMIIDPPPKPVPAEIKLNHFLIKSGKTFIDISNGRLFKEYKEKTYSLCTHGLCKKLNTLAIKNIVKKSHNPSVFYAIENKPKENKSVRIKYQNENKKQQVWEFDSQEINECIKGIDEGINNRQMAVRLFAPRETILTLIKHIDINQKIERSRNGNDKSSSNSRVARRKAGRKTRREN